MPALKSRFSLGDLILFVALAAVALASKIEQSAPLKFSIASWSATCGSLAILVAYRRLSPWIWIVIICQADWRVANKIEVLLDHIGLFQEASWLFGSFVWPLMFWVGVWMTLRAAHRRIVDLEARMADRPVVAAPAGEPIASDLPA